MQKYRLTYFGLFYALGVSSLVTVSPFLMTMGMPVNRHDVNVDMSILFLLCTVISFLSFRLNMFIYNKLTVPRKILANIAAYLMLTFCAIWIHQPIWEKIPIPQISFIRDEFIRNSVLFVVSYFVALFLVTIQQNQDIKTKFTTLKEENLINQLESLRQQLDPHFFFNTLNNLSGLIREDSDKSLRFVENLSDVFRYVLSSKSKNLVSLDEEFGFLDAYLYLQKIRYEEKIVVKNEVNPNPMIKIPSMGIQVLIENAIKHNSLSRQEPLIIEISIDDQWLTVSNTTHPKSLEAKGTGTGLKNLSKRSILLIGRDIEVVKTTEKFTVKIPYFLT
jgi:hypothetical protein